MTGTDPVARLIPWYAAGTLDAAECAQVETHLASCDECRDLLALARGFRRLAPQVRQETLFDHIQAQRLVEFAEDPAALEPDARRFITSHIRSCATCAEALEILEDLGQSPAAGDLGTTRRPPIAGLPDRLGRAWADLWRRLSRSILHPGPALAYLGALVVLLILLPLRPPAPGPVPEPPTPAPSPRPPISLLPPAIELPEEVTFRSGQPPPPPLTVQPPAAAEVVPFVLVTSLETEDLADPEASFRIAIVQGDRTLFERECRGTDFDRRGRLMLFLDPAAIAPDVPCRASIVRVKPGDPADGEEVYRRSFLIVAPTHPPR